MSDSLAEAESVAEEPVPPSPPGRTRRPRVVYAFVLLALALFFLGGIGGSYQGKLGSVQKNDNAAYLPGSAESTKVDKGRSGSAPSRRSRVSSSTSVRPG